MAGSGDRHWRNHETYDSEEFQEWLDRMAAFVPPPHVETRYKIKGRLKKESADAIAQIVKADEAEFEMEATARWKKGTDLRQVRLWGPQTVETNPQDNLFDQLQTEQDVDGDYLGLVGNVDDKEEACQHPNIIGEGYCVDCEIQLPPEAFSRPANVPDGEFSGEKCEHPQFFEDGTCRACGEQVRASSVTMASGMPDNDPETGGDLSARGMGNTQAPVTPDPDNDEDSEVATEPKYQSCLHMRVNNDGRCHYCFEQVTEPLAQGSEEPGEDQEQVDKDLQEAAKIAHEEQKEGNGRRRGRPRKTEPATT